VRVCVCVAHGSVARHSTDVGSDLWSMLETHCQLPFLLLTAVMVRRYDVNFPAKRASFNKDGSAVIACADFDIQVGPRAAQ
jgi:hypothetical protein